MNSKKLIHQLIVPPGKKISLTKDYDPGYSPGQMTKSEAADTLQQAVQRLALYQEKLYAQDTYSLLIILQAMDAAGKDSIIKHVMSGLNPQGCDVRSFKAPSSEELDHDFLWRSSRALPRRGHIGIFNRSYYEEVLVVRVHPEILDSQRLPKELKGKGIWKRRFEDINCWEKCLVNNGTLIVKFFLNVSKEEQKRRFLQRIDRPEKNWKFSVADAQERACWDDYQNAYEDVFNNTSTDWAPWYIIPADNKPVARLAVSTVLHDTLRKMDLAFPNVGEAQKEKLAEIRKVLENER